MAELIHQDMTFYYEIHGEGIPVLFLAGTMADHSIWLQNLPEFNNYQVILFDNRDVGQSSLASQPYGAKEMAADALALLQHLNLPAAHVIGHSLGGQIAQELYFLAPERVRSLILFNTWAKTDNYCASLFWLWQTLRDRLVNQGKSVSIRLDTREQKKGASHFLFKRQQGVHSGKHNDELALEGRFPVSTEHLKF